MEADRFDPRRILAIVNPISGRGVGPVRAERIAAVWRAAGRFVEIRRTECAGHARQMAADAWAWDMVLCVGGDGTLNEVINGLPAGAPPLALGSVGTANVLSRELGLSRRWKQVARLLDAPRVRVVDLGLCDEQRFALMVGVGADGEVVTRFHQRRVGPIHLTDYVGVTLRYLSEYRAPRIRVIADGRVLTERASMVQVANCANYGGFFYMAPAARVTDGLLEVAAYLGPQKRDVARYLWAGFWRGADRLVDVRRVAAREVRLESDKPVHRQIDGDPGGALPAAIRVLPGALRIVVPGGGL